MKPVIALIGRPNVGKSTFFNRMTKSRDALVANEPGLTRDRRYGLATIDEHQLIVIDTGGFSDDQNELNQLIAEQAKQAIAECDVALFLVDGKAGCLPGDEEIAKFLRRIGKPVYVAVNKTEKMHKVVLTAEFHRLGFANVFAVSAAHGEGVGDLLEQVVQSLPIEPVDPLEQDDTPKIAIVGRPNVGKSTLINRLIGEQRMLAYDMPGTTRDSIFVPFEHEGKSYTLIDTAGVRRRARVAEKIEKFSVIKTLQAIDASSVVVLVLDAQEEIASQDAHLLGYAIDAGRSVIIAVNKWDGLAGDQRLAIKKMLDRKLVFASYITIRFISALHGSGVGELIKDVKKIYDASIKKYPTSVLNPILQQATDGHQPPLVRGRRIKLRFVHQAGHNPPKFVIHGNQTEHVPLAYCRYLEKIFRKALALTGVPIKLEFKSGDNPFKGRLNVLTKRQVMKKKRLKKFVSKRKRN